MGHGIRLLLTDIGVDELFKTRLPLFVEILYDTSSRIQHKTGDVAF